MTLPDLTSLRCFVAVARSLHFRTAAEQVGLSATAFSERIRRLEEDLGVPLLQRSTRQVALSAAGERLLPHAERLLAEAARLAQAAADDRELPYALTIGTRYELGLSWLVPALQPLRTARPARTLHLRFGDSVDLLRAVERGEIDAAVTSVRLGTHALHYAPLHNESYVLVGGPGEPALCAVGDLAGRRVIDAHPDLPLFRYLLDTLPADRVPVLADVHCLGTIAAMAMQVRAGEGVAVLPAYFVAADLRAGRMRQLLPDHPLLADRFRLVWRASHPQPERLRALATELAQLPLQGESP